MKNKKTLLHILIYVGILTAIIVTFIAVTTFQNAGNFVDAYIAKEEISSATTITNSTFDKYFKTIKYRYEDENEIKEAGGKLVKNVSDVSGKTTISKIPAGTVLLTDMFEVATNGTGLWNSEVENMFGISRDDTNEIEYITLKASKQTAPANSFVKNQHLIIENVNAITVGDDENTEDLYGVLVNKALLHTVYKDANGEISNVGIIVSKEDAKNLSTLQDQNITFRFYEGNAEDFPLSTWSKSDVYSNLLDRLSNKETDFKLYINDKSTGKISYSPYLEYSEDDFGFVNEYVTTNDLELFWYGNHSKAIVSCYDLSTGLKNENVVENGIYSRNTSEISKKLIYSNNTFKTTMPTLTSDGYYEIEIIGEETTHLIHFIKSKTDAFTTDSKARKFNIATKKNAEDNEVLDSIQIGYNDVVNNNSVNVEQLKKYTRNVIFNEDLISQYNKNGELINGSLENVRFFVPEDTIIATFGNNSYTAEDITIKDISGYESPLFYEYEQVNSTNYIADSYNSYKVKIGGYEKPLSPLFQTLNIYEFKNLLENMGLKIQNDYEIVPASETIGNFAWKFYVLTGIVLNENSGPNFDDECDKINFNDDFTYDVTINR